METIQVLGYFGALAVGLVLGLMGSGGSIMAVPILTYMFHISPVTTTAYSLFVVGTSSSVGALKNFKKGLIDFKIALVFATPGFVAVFISRKFIVPTIPEELIQVGNFVLTRSKGIMFLLAMLMIIASISMLRKREQPIKDNILVRFNYPIMIFVGAVIGILTGIVGIGGGFLIIPALVLLVKLPMKKAVATSLFIISLKSLIGFMGGLGILDINWTFLLVFTLISVLGILFGAYLSSFVKSEKLKRGFGWFVLFMAIGIFCKEMFN